MTNNNAVNRSRDVWLRLCAYIFDTADDMHLWVAILQWVREWKVQEIRNAISAMDTMYVPFEENSLKAIRASGVADKLPYMLSEQSERLDNYRRRRARLLTALQFMEAQDLATVEEKEMRRG